MDINIFDAINYLTTSTKIGAILKLCEYKTVSDFINFNDKSVDKIEEYVQIQCSMMDEKERALYLTDSDIANPSSFMISPGLRNRLLKAISVLLQTTKPSPLSFGINKSKSINSNLKLTDKNPQIYPALDNRKIVPIQQKSTMKNAAAEISYNNDFKKHIIHKSTPLIIPAQRIVQLMPPPPPTINNLPTVHIKPIENRPTLITKNNDNAEAIVVRKRKKSRGKSDVKLEEMKRNCEEKIAQDHAVHYLDCHMRPGIDFYVDCQFNSASPAKSNCFYVCKLCPDDGKRFVFHLSKALLPIQTGIKSHNRIHFTRNPDRFSMA